MTDKANKLKAKIVSCCATKYSPADIKIPNAAKTNNKRFLLLPASAIAPRTGARITITALAIELVKPS